MCGYCNGYDDYVFLGEEKVARTAVTGDTREIMTVLLKLTVNTLKTANYDIDSYCYVLRELFLEESDAES